MTEWRTIVSASGVKAHAYEGHVPRCGCAPTRGYQRAPVDSDRRCGLCERVLAREAARQRENERRAQEPLPFGPVNGANAAMAAAWKGGVR